MVRPIVKLVPLYLHLKWRPQPKTNWFKVFNFLGGQLWSALVTFINPALLQFDERRQETGLGVGLGCNVSSEGVVTAQKTRSYNIYVTQDIYYLDNWTFWN